MMTMIERVGPTAVAAACLLALIAALPAWAEEPAEGTELPTKQIKMFAENWKWSPDMIRVKAGQKLSIEVQNVDSPHRFEMKKLGLKVALPEGETTLIEFVVDEPGTYRWRCSRPCGNGCAKMTGKLVVEPSEP